MTSVKRQYPEFNSKVEDCMSESMGTAKDIHESIKIMIGSMAKPKKGFYQVFHLQYLYYQEYSSSNNKHASIYYEQHRH